MPASPRTRCARRGATSGRSRRVSRRSWSSRMTTGLNDRRARPTAVPRLRAAATVSATRRTALTQTAPTATDQLADRHLVSVQFPAARSDGPVEGVALVTLERPDVLNALSFDLLDELADALAVLDADRSCRAIVVTGSGDRAFAAGADIRELARQTPVTLLVDDRFAVWERIAAVRTPVVAAVRGFALGGGCELAMTCDLIGAGGRSSRCSRLRTRQKGWRPSPRSADRDGRDADRWNVTPGRRAISAGTLPGTWATSRRGVSATARRTSSARSTPRRPCPAMF